MVSRGVAVGERVALLSADDRVEFTTEELTRLGLPAEESPQRLEQADPPTRAQNPRERRERPVKSLGVV